MSEVVREVIKRSLEVSEYSTYYTHEFSCGNCGRRQHCYVLKGRSLKGLDIGCTNCGCNVRLAPFHQVYSE